MKKIIIFLLCIVVLLLGLFFFFYQKSKFGDLVATEVSKSGNNYEYSPNSATGVSSATSNQDLSLNNPPQQSDVSIPEGSLLLSDKTIIPIPQAILKNEASTTLTDDIFRKIDGNDSGDYTISYLPYNKKLSEIEFNITLNSLPLSSSRSKAESALKTKLNLSPSDICKLNISVWVMRWTSEQFAGRDLGLSFCSGSTILP